MQGFILTANTAAKKLTLFLDDVNFLDSTQNLTKSVEREIKVKGTGSRCLLEVCVKGKYYARFHTLSYHCYSINCGRTDGQKVEPLYRTLL